MLNEQLFFKNVLKYETDQLKTNAIAFFFKINSPFAKSTDTDAKQTVKRYQEKSYPRENVTRIKLTLELQAWIRGNLHIIDMLHMGINCFHFVICCIFVKTLHQYNYRLGNIYFNSKGVWFPRIARFKLNYNLLTK